MAYKIKRFEVDQMTDRIANECADWEDVVWILADYLPYDVLEAIAVWDEVNSDDMTIQNISDIEAGCILADKYGVEWLKRESRMFDVYFDPPANPALESVCLSATELYIRGPIHVVGH